MVPVSVYAEMTPNPAVLKFVANKRLISEDHIEFKNIEEAKPSPIAVKLFHYPFVKEVFISGNYIAITKYDIVEWEDVTLELREMIRNYLQTAMKPLKNLWNKPLAMLHKWTLSNHPANPILKKKLLKITKKLRKRSFLFWMNM